MRLVSQEAMMYGSAVDPFRDSQWSGYEIPVSGLNMQEVEDVVERFNIKSPVLVPMRSPLSQKAANAVQNIVLIDAKAIVGAEEEYVKRQGKWIRSGNGLAKIAVLAELRGMQYRNALMDAFGEAPEKYFVGYGRKS